MGISLVIKGDNLRLIIIELTSSMIGVKITEQYSIIKISLY